MTVDITQPTQQDSLSLEELSLYHAITAYRASLGLEALPLSGALTTTAGRHVADTRENIWAEGVVLPDGANLHSWSDGFYYSDHRDPSVMWTAPQRVGTDYASSGYEISAAGFTTTDAALEGWKNSPSHNAILAGTGVWEGIELNAIGIGVDTSPGAGIYEGRIFHVWFGESEDVSIPTIMCTEYDDLVEGTLFADRISGLGGIDDIRGNNGDDTLYGGDGDDLVRGGNGRDSVFAGWGDDQVWGGSGLDTINGGPGNDSIWGGDSADTIDGGLGEDVIFGGNGGDILTGGAGADVFVINSPRQSFSEERRDVITDFFSGEDVIRLLLVDGDDSTPERDALRYVGAAAFTGAAGELRMSAGLAEADVNGDLIADMQFEVRGFDLLAETDFIL